MKWLPRRATLTLGGVIFVIGIPGIIEDFGTWGEWFFWLPEGWWIIPLCLGSAIAVFGGALRLGRREGKLETFLESPNPTRAAHAPKSESPSPPTPEERVYTPRSPFELMELAKGKTTLAAKGAVQPHLGKWLRVSGTLREMTEVPSNSDESAAYLALIDLEDEERHIEMVVLIFDGSWKSRLEMLAVGDKVLARGKLRQIRQSDVTLEGCELDDR